VAERRGERERERENAFKIGMENLKGRDHLEDLGLDGRVISELILGKQVGSCGLDSSSSVWGLVASCCEHDNETSSSIKDGEFLY
jgi:hypothetical protein